MFDFASLLSSAALVSLVSLTLLEIVLGIDNIIFVSILASKLPKNEQGKARNIGLFLALILRLLLLFGIGYIQQLTKPFFTLFEHPFSGRDLILIAGGLFLMYKSVGEIHEKIEGSSEDQIKSDSQKSLKFTNAIVQITLLNMVFSVDSILTAIGLTTNLVVMMVSIVISVVVMMLFSAKISRFIDDKPTIKMLALAFLLMVGMILMLEGFHQAVPKGYVYFAMAFSVSVEMLNLYTMKKRQPIKLHDRFEADQQRLDQTSQDNKTAN